MLSLSRVLLTIPFFTFIALPCASTMAQESTLIYMCAVSVMSASDTITEPTSGKAETEMFSLTADEETLAVMASHDRDLIERVAQAVVDEILAYRYDAFFQVNEVPIWILTSEEGDIEVVHWLFPFGALYRKAYRLDELISLAQRQEFIRYHVVPTTRGDCMYAEFWESK